jgi:hypothetical protein
MVDEREAAETQTNAAGSTDEPASAGTNGAQAEEQQRQDSDTAGPQGDWPDLDTYCAQLRAEHESWLERLTALQSQLAHLQPALLGIAAQYRALAIEEDLDQLNRLVLGGAAMAQTLRLGYDLERYISLLWPAAGDPRPTHARPDSEGEYRVDVLLHVGPDGHGRIRVEGEKRLEAPLPTSRERLRRVLLGAIQAPKFVGRTGEDAAEAAAEGSTTPASEQAGEPPHDGRLEGQAEAAAQAEPRTEVGTDEPVPAAEPRPGDPDDQPPPEEQVIPLGPASDAGSEQAPKRRRKKS